MSTQAWSLMGQAEQPPSVLFGETEMELWPYRRRTVALLRRYARASVEVGRLPSLLGREFFRSRVTSYTMRNFEDVVIFVADMEQAIQARMLAGMEDYGPLSKQVQGQRELTIDFNGQVWEERQPIVAIIQGQVVDNLNCSLTRK